MFKKAEVHTEQAPEAFFDMHFKGGTLSASHAGWIKFALTTLRRIVEENIAYRRDRVQGIMDMNLLEQHAKANGITISKDTHKDDDVVMSEAIPAPSDFDLHAHQKQAIEAFVKFKEGESQFELMDMATGTGKTRVQMALSQMLLSSDTLKPIFIVTPTKQLVQQFYSDFVDYINSGKAGNILPHHVVKISSNTSDIHVSLLKVNHSLENQKLVMIFCGDSFLRYIEQAQVMEPQCIFLDECHKFNKKQVQTILDKYKQASVKTVGLTATPAKDMVTSYDKIFEYTRVQAVKDKIISPVILNKLQENYSPKMAQAKISSLTALLQGHVHPNGHTLEKLKGVIYLPSIRDLEKAYALLQSQIKVFKAHSREKGCDEQVSQFKSTKEPCIMLAVGMLRIGFSDKDVDYGIVLKSAVADDVKQILGRVVRYKEGKIGYLLGFSDINTDAMETMLDKEALERCSEVFKKQSPHLFAMDIKNRTFTPFRDARRSSAQPDAMENLAPRFSADKSEYCVPRRYL